MSDFTPIQTQEEFDKAIRGRLAQKDRELEEKYKDYLSPDKVSSLREDYEKKLEEAKKSVAPDKTLFQERRKKPRKSEAKRRPRPQNRPSGTIWNRRAICH